MKPAVLTATHWEGPLPLPGHYIASPRGRCAYLVLGVRVPEVPRKFVAKITCERRPRAELDGATVYEWRWNKRRRRR